MLATAKVFTNGNSQAIRLPKAFRVDVDEMWIARNEVTGEISLKPKDTETLRQRRLDALMAAHQQMGGHSAWQGPSGFLRNATYERPQR